MGEVVRLPRAGAEGTEAEARARRAARFEALERVLRDRPLMGRPDQLRAAEALWRLLQRAEQRNVTKAKVLRAARIGAEGDSTKHLSHYALDPSLPDARKERARLNKRPTKYRQIAEAAARLAGWDEREAVLEVFNETTLAGTRPGQEAAPEYEALAQTLREVADAVAAKHGLQAYFQEVAKSKPVLRVLNDEEETAKNRLEPEEIELYFDEQSDILTWPMSFDCESGDRQHVDCEGKVPPYPTVVLGAWRVGDEFQVLVESDECLRDGERGPSPVGGTTEGSYVVELRFCVVPEGPDMQPVGALRVSTSVELMDIHSDGNPFDPIIRFDDSIFLPGNEAERRCIIASSGRRIDCHLRYDAGDVPELIGKYFDFSVWHLGITGCRFLPLTGPACQDWLGIKMDWDNWHAREKPLHVRVLGPALLDNEIYSGFSPFPTETVASALDRCLTGHGPGDPVALLDERTAHLVELLADAQDDAKRSRAAGYKNLATRLRAMREGNEKG